MSNINLEKTMHSLETGRLIDAYTGVIIHTGINDSGKEITYSSGNNTGYVLEVDNPHGTQALADSLLAMLKTRGVRYQPFRAGNAPIDPAAEIGDTVTVNGKDAVIMAIRTDHSTLMSADLSAPYDEEVDHEFKYEPKINREFKRETKYARARLTVNEEAITAEAIRATSAEEVLSGRLTVAADAITAEVARATAAEGTLSGRISVTAEAITAEVTRATAAEGQLSTQITQTADSITSSVSATYETKTDAQNKLTEANGYTDTKATALTASYRSEIKQSADSIKSTVAASEKTYSIPDGITISVYGFGAPPASTAAEYDGRYYLNQSSGIYYKSNGTAWVKQNNTPLPLITNELSTKIDQRLDSITLSVSSNSGTSTFTLKDGSTTLDTKTLDLSVKSVNISGTLTIGQLENSLKNKINGAVKRSSVIYYSTDSDLTAQRPAAPTSWVSTVSASDNMWTLTRPQYSRDYKYLYTARQTETEDGTYSCTTPTRDYTTTVIDGANLITGSITANKISVTDLSALQATIGGWKITTQRLEKTVKVGTVDKYWVGIRAGGATANTAAFGVQAYNEDTSTWDWQFYARYDGAIYARKGTIGDLTLANGVVKGIKDTNITPGGISGGSGGSIAEGTVTTWNTNGGINTNLNYGAAYGLATTNGTSSFPDYFKVKYLTVTGSVSTPHLTMVSGGTQYGVSLKSAIVKLSDDTTKTIYYLAWQ